MPGQPFFRQEMSVMTGRVALITGASQEIGAGLVAGYRGRGWSVAATPATIGGPPDPEVLTVEGDIADPATADRIVGGALERFGRIDTLVSNVGMVTAEPFAEYTAADYAAVVAVSLAGFCWVTQRAIGEMAVRYGGHVVTVTVSASLAEGADCGAHGVLAAVATGGLAAATRSLAVEYADLGIRVNAVSAGGIAAVSDLVAGVLFLESSPYITGEILHIDGGAR
jgi:NAD(P)-dependent dehydrogenase (short-subunit alcohol dehydrogenase family)